MKSICSPINHRPYGLSTWHDVHPITLRSHSYSIFFTFNSMQYAAMTLTMCDAKYKCCPTYLCLLDVNLPKRLFDDPRQRTASYCSSCLCRHWPSQRPAWLLCFLSPFQYVKTVNRILVLICSVQSESEKIAVRRWLSPCIVEFNS